VCTTSGRLRKEDSKSQVILRYIGKPYLQKKKEEEEGEGKEEEKEW
jgi:hypothetical protein